jgi:hypothetical protein
MARRADVDATRITRWKTGENRPAYDNVVQLVNGVTRDHPEIADLGPELFRAAGYAPELPTDDRPQIVKDNWDNDNVRTLWGLGVPEPQRLSMIKSILPPAQPERRQRRA